MSFLKMTYSNEKIHVERKYPSLLKRLWHEILQWVRLIIGNPTHEKIVIK